MFSGQKTLGCLGCHPKNRLFKVGNYFHFQPKILNESQVKHANKSFTLTGRSVAEILLFVLGFLLNNDLLVGCCKSFDRLGDL